VLTVQRAEVVNVPDIQQRRVVLEGHVGPSGRADLLDVEPVRLAGRGVLAPDALALSLQDRVLVNDLVAQRRVAGL